MAAKFKVAAKTKFACKNYKSSYLKNKKKVSPVLVG
jgi:hypothetical protein